MGVYIKGMEMPKGKDVLTLAITADGEVYSIGFDSLIDGGIFLSHPGVYPVRAVPVPPHGRLIDADALLSKDRQIYRSDGAAIGARRYIEFSEIEDAPTIIPAEEGET